MLAGEGLQLGRHLSVTPACQVGFDAVLQGGQAALFQPPRLHPGEGSVGNIGQGGTPPQTQRLPQRRRGPDVVTRTPLDPPSGNELLEAQGIDRVRIDLQQVAVRSSDDDLTGHPEGLAQPGDVDPQRPDSALGGIPAPQILGQTGRRDNAVGIEDEQGQERPFPAAPE